MNGQATLDGDDTGQQEFDTGSEQTTVEVEQAVDESNTDEGNDIEKLAGAIVSALNQANSEQDPSDSENGDVYHITEELTITQNPEKHLIDSPTGDEYGGIRKYDDAPTERVPNDVAFISGSQEGDVSTKEELLRALATDTTNPMLIGDAGTAKNTSIDSVYNSLGQPLYRFQCGAGASKFDLVAETKLRDGNTVTTLKQVGKAAVFGGGVVLDEINLLDDRLTPVLNAICEKVGNRSVTLPGAGVTLTDLPEDEEWDAEKHLGKYIHPEFRIVATRNPPTYTGADIINNALNDRFSPIWYAYLGIEKEAEILAVATNTEQSDVQALVRVVQNKIRKPRKHGNGVTCPISFRRLQDAVEYSVDHGVSLYSGAKQKVAMYAQSEADKRKLKSTLKDEKSDLGVTPTEVDHTDMDGVSDENAVFECTNCGWSVGASEPDDDSKVRTNGICGDCGGPFVEKTTE